MTTEELIRKQRIAFNNIIQKDEPLRLAAYTAHSDATKRIFTDGKNSSDGNIGQYATSPPMYINPDKAPRAGALKVKGIEGLKPTKGKHGEHLFKNGKAHKTTYVNSYKDFRNRIGRRTDKVNLVLSGDLQSDFANGKITNPAPKKVNAHTYIVTLSREINQKKRGGLEDKYGEVFSHTTNEVNKFFKVANQEFKNQLSKAGL